MSVPLCSHIPPESLSGQGWGKHAICTLATVCSPLYRGSAVQGSSVFAVSLTVHRREQALNSLLMELKLSFVILFTISLLWKHCKMNKSNTNLIRTKKQRISKEMLGCSVWKVLFFFPKASFYSAHDGIRAPTWFPEDGKPIPRALRSDTQLLCGVPTADPASLAWFWPHAAVPSPPNEAKSPGHLCWC